MTLVHVVDSAASAWPWWADFVLCYPDGEYANVKLAPPNAHIIQITVTGLSGVRWCDCENGTLTVADTAQWAVNEYTAGRHPGIYCSLDRRGPIERELDSLRHGASIADWWLADPDGSTIIPAGWNAKQFSWPAPNHPVVAGQRYDVSVMYLECALEADQ
jgi:hypothetical protein